jgi:hypothetical protein
LALALAAALGPGLQRVTGAGPWALRTALALTVLMIGASALGALDAPGTVHLPDWIDTEWLKQLVADLSLDNQMLKHLSEGNW